MAGYPLKFVILYCELNYVDTRSIIAIGSASTWPRTAAGDFGTTIVALLKARGVGLVSYANFVSKSPLMELY